MMTQFSGSIVAIITPLDEQGNIDWKSFKNLVDYHVASGTDAIVACGTTGETATLTDEEYVEVVKKCVEYAAGRIPVIAGTGSNNTAKAIANTKKMEGLGVAACLTVVPYYNKPSQEGLYRHFKAIAESTALPQILYNVPGRTVTSMDVETVVRLAALPNVIAIKDAHQDLSRVTAIVEGTKGLGFTHLSGDDPNALEAIARGSRGIVSVSANVIAKEWADIVHKALAGDLDGARADNERFKDFHQGLFCEPNPTPVKWIAQQLGLIASAKQRLPLIELSVKGEEKVRALCAQAGVKLP